jgi:protoheme IX farnesyltransferase
MSGSIKNKAARRLERIGTLASLFKLPVSFMSAGAVLMGYSAYDPFDVWQALWPALSVFFLAAGSAALNNVQDRRIDAGMERTRRRPLPAGRLSPAAGVVLAALAIAAGMAGLLVSTASYAAPLAGAAAVVLYNALYTPLKKRTQLAMIPGVICGMFPSLIGWLAASGSLFSFTPWYLMILFGTWQIPHFWLILMAHRDDYRRNGIPSILDQFSEQHIKNVLLVWVAAFSVLLLFMRPLFPTHHGAPALIPIALALGMPPMFILLLRVSESRSVYKFLFHFLNGSAFIIAMTLVMDAAA